MQNQPLICVYDWTVPMSSGLLKPVQQLAGFCLLLAILNELQEWTAALLKQPRLANFPIPSLTRRPDHGLNCPFLRNSSGKCFRWEKLWIWIQRGHGYFMGKQKEGIKYGLSNKTGQEQNMGKGWFVEFKKERAYEASRGSANCDFFH